MSGDILVYSDLGFVGYDGIRAWDQASGSRFDFLGSGIRIQGLGLRVWEFGLRSSEHGFRALGQVWSGARLGVEAPKNCTTS